jgi:NADH-quinone oxidoreductase subunit D
MEFYERASGARMHAAFHKPLNLFSAELDLVFIQDILYFIQNCYTTLNEMHNVLTYNKIWKQRLVNIGTINQEICESYNLSGVMTRSCGIKRDLRLSPKDVYSNYNLFSFKSYFGVNGDCYDRYLIRMLEMGESLHISNLVINNLLMFNNLGSNVVTNILQNTYFNNNINMYGSMEDLINHFLH